MNSSDPRPHQRLMLRILLLAFVLALAALLLPLHAPNPSPLASPLPLQLAGTAAGFKQALQADWQQAPLAADSNTICGWGVAWQPGVAAGLAGASFDRLRCNLFADSLVFVPAYVGLLLFFTLVFGPPPRRQLLLRHLLCVPAVGAGLFDIAENGMTGRAIDELVFFSLSNATAADVAHASRVKWVLLGLAFAILAWRLAVGALREQPQWPLALPCGLAGAALVVGGLLSAPAWIAVGLGAAIAALAWLSRRWWQAATAPPASGSAVSPPAHPSPPADPPAA